MSKLINRESLKRSLFKTKSYIDNKLESIRDVIQTINKVDSTFSLESENPVMNKVLTDRINGIDTRIDLLPTKLSQFEDDVVAGKYLPLSGGMMQGGINWAIEQTSAWDNYFDVGGNRGLRILNAVGYSVDGAPSDYASALIVSGYYGYALAWDAYYEQLKYRGSGKSDWRTILHAGNYSGYALPLTGGTITIDSITSLIVKRNDTGGSFICFDNNNGNLGFLGVGSDGVPKFASSDGVGKNIWHAGNFNPADYLPLTGGKIESASGNYTPLIVKNTSLSEVWIAFIDSVGTTHIGSVRGVPSINSGSGNQTLIHSGNIGSQSVASATKLSDNTAFSAWGQTFFENGKPKSIDGNIYINSLSAIESYGSGFIFGWGKRANPTRYCGSPITFYVNNVERMFINESGNVTIGSTDLAGTGSKLYVDGNTYIRSKSTSDFNGILNLYNPSITSGLTQSINLGYNDAPKNYAWLGFYFDGLGSSKNAVRLGLSGGVDVLTINGYGNVLVGTTEDDGSGAKLYVNGNKVAVAQDANAEMQIYVKNSIARAGILLASTGHRGFYDFTKDSWVIATDGTKTWLNAGNVGIGTANPAYKLDVNGDTHISGNLIVDGTITPSTASTSYSLRGGTSNKTVVIIEVGSTEETIEHGLGADVAVSLYAKDTTKDDSWVLTSNGDIEITDTSVIITFDNPTLVEYKVVIVG